MTFSQLLLFCTDTIANFQQISLFQMGLNTKSCYKKFVSIDYSFFAGWFSGAYCSGMITSFAKPKKPFRLSFAGFGMSPHIVWKISHSQIFPYVTGGILGFSSFSSFSGTKIGQLIVFCGTGAGISCFHATTVRYHIDFY